MSWSVTLTLWCDSCSKWEQYPQTYGKQDIERLAKKAGWVVKTTNRKEHFCPACSERLGYPGGALCHSE